MNKRKSSQKYESPFQKKMLTVTPVYPVNRIYYIQDKKSRIIFST